MGSLFQRKKRRADGTVVELPTWWIKYRQYGRTIVESTHTRKETVARRILQVREGDIARGRHVDPHQDRITFDEAAADLINDYVINRRRSLGVLKRRIHKHLNPVFRGQLLAAITTPTIRAYIAKRLADTILVRRACIVQTKAGQREIPERRRSVSNGEINRELTALKRMFSLAMQAGKISHRPHIPMLEEAPPRKGFFEREQIEAVCRQLPEALASVIWFGYHTGWRIDSEVLPLTWAQVDVPANVVRLEVGTTKNREGRVFPLTKELRAVLARRRDLTDRLQREQGQIIPCVFYRLIAHGRGGPKQVRPIRSYLKAWRVACRAAGLPGRIPHDLRRTAVRNLERSSVPRSTAMAMVGHKTESIYRRYAIVDETMLQEAAAKMDRQRGSR